MGESPGRLAALSLVYSAVLLTPAAAAQSRSPAGDKGGAKGLAGTIVQFEEKASRTVIYLEEKGGLVTPVASPTLPEKPLEKSTQREANNGASPLRASQAKPAPAPGAARP